MDYFETNFREEFPFLSSILYDNNPINGSNHLSQQYFPHHFNQFSSKEFSKNLFFGITSSSTYVDPVLDYFTNGFSSTNDYNNFIPSSTPYLLDTVNDGTTLLHGLQENGYNWDFSNPIQNQEMINGFNSITLDHDQTTQIYNQSMIDFQEFGSGSRAVYKLPADEFSFINGQKGYQKKAHDDQKKKRVSKSQKKVMIKGQWTQEEDSLLVQLVTIYGTKRWAMVATMMKGRVGKQCRERWYNHLKPDIKKEQWTEEEDKILIEEHKIVGNRWAEIAHCLPGRTENTIKNHWNAMKRRQSSKSGPGNDTTPKLTLLQNYIRSVSAATSPSTSSFKSLSSKKKKTTNTRNNKWKRVLTEPAAAPASNYNHALPLPLPCQQTAANHMIINSNMNQQVQESSIEYYTSLNWQAPTVASMFAGSGSRLDSGLSSIVDENNINVYCMDEIDELMAFEMENWMVINKEMDLAEMMQGEVFS